MRAAVFDSELQRLFATLILVGGPLFASGDEPSRFRLHEAASAWSIISPNGSPTFLIGINHLRDTVPPGVNHADYYKAAIDNTTSWGMNHLGYGTPRELHSELPFIQDQTFTSAGHFREPHRFEYVDVFDPEFQRRTRTKVRAVCESVQNHPNLIGHYWTDTPRWNIDKARRFRGKDWVSAIRELPPDAAGKHRYAEFLRNRYHDDPAAYTAAYGHLIADFDDIRLFDFREFDRSNQAGRRDDEAFLGLIAEELYRVLGTAYREFAPGVLMFGERYKLHDHPDAVLKAAAKWVDVISIQPGPEVGPRPGPGRDEAVFDGDTFDRIHMLTGKPIQICDHRVSFYTEAAPVTLWNQFRTEQEAVDAAAAFMCAAASKPYVVGYSHCQYRDKRRPERGNLVKPGFIRDDGRPYETYIRGIAAANKAIQRIHAEKFAH